MSETFVCIRCNGDKQLFAFINGGPDIRSHSCAMIDCDTCAGTGVISEEKLMAITAGKDLRADRIQRGRTISEEAARLKMTPAQYSALERGREPIAPLPNTR